MAVKYFISPSVKWVPQIGFSVVFNENGGIEAAQDILVRNSDLQAGSILGAFARGAAWVSIFPEVPTLFQNLTLKTYDPTDRGDGWSIVKCTFTGYSYGGNGSSGEEESVATTSLSGQLEDVPLSQHPKWKALSVTSRAFLGMQINGDISMNSALTLWGTYQEDEVSRVFVPVVDDNGDSVTPSGDALKFALIIASGESTFRRGGWTYSYHTASKIGFKRSQLSQLGKIIANPPGDPIYPGDGWKWQLTGPNQTQSGIDSFSKTLDFQLIPDNETNTFLYE